MNFIEKLNEVVEQLKNDENIEIIQFEVFPPAVSEIEEVEAMLGYKLDSSITDFYRECGGVKLIWVDSTKNEEGYMSETADYFIENKEELQANKDNFFVLNSGDYYMPVDGAIIIPNIKYVFSEDWSGSISDEIDIINSFENSGLLKKSNVDESKFKIVPFDLYNEYDHVSFLLTGNENPYVAFSNDAFASFSESKLFTFAEYLDILLESKGSLEKRGELMRND